MAISDKPDKTAVEYDLTQPQTGLPRPVIDYDHTTYKEYKKMLVPWINWRPALEAQNFLSFDENSLRTLHSSKDMLCSICGLELGRNKILAHLNSETATSGAAQHPSCALLAFHYCPMLKSQGADYSFSLYTGEGSGIVYHASMPDDISEVLIHEDANPITMAELKELAAKEKAEKAGDSRA